MIGTKYESDQRIVDIYKNTKTLAENNEEKIPVEKVLDYFEMISVTNKSMLNFKLTKLKKVS